MNDVATKTIKRSADAAQERPDDAEIFAASCGHSNVTSERQILANRRNALKSTGPRTTAGREKVRANALKHGLSARTQGSRVDPRALQLAALAVGLQAADAAAKQRLWAEAHAELTRADAYRQNLMATALLRLDADTAADVVIIIDQLVKGLHRLNRYERHLHARLRRWEGGEFKKLRGKLQNKANSIYRRGRHTMKET